MRFDHHVYFHSEDKETKKALEKIMALLDDLKSQVEGQNTVIGSAIELLNGLHAKLDALTEIGDPAQLKADVAALAAEIGSQKQALADAVVANTPAA